MERKRPVSYTHLCINEKSNPDFIEKQERGDLVKLHSTRFKLVFANDILKEARTAWIHYFAKYGYTPDVYREESIVDLSLIHIWIATKERCLWVSNN